MKGMSGSKKHEQQNYDKRYTKQYVEELER